MKRGGVGFCDRLPSYTWAPNGQQPEVKSRGKRKAYKVFGLIDDIPGGASTYAEAPQSTLRICPVIPFEASEAKNNAAQAISMGSEMRPRGYLANVSGVSYAATSDGRCIAPTSVLV
jgi:hypothetical protein